MFFAQIFFYCSRVLFYHFINVCYTQVFVYTCFWYFFQGTSNRPTSINYCFFLLFHIRYYFYFGLILCVWVFFILLAPCHLQYLKAQEKKERKEILKWYERKKINVEKLLIILFGNRVINFKNENKKRDNKATSCNSLAIPFFFLFLYTCCLFFYIF